MCKQLGLKSYTIKQQVSRHLTTITVDGGQVKSYIYKRFFCKFIFEFLNLHSIDLWNHPSVQLLHLLIMLQQLFFFEIVKCHSRFIKAVALLCSKLLLHPQLGGFSSYIFPTNLIMFALCTHNPQVLNLEFSRKDVFLVFQHL